VKFLTSLISLFLYSSLGYGQIIEQELTLKTSGYGATNEDLPFWLTNNTFSAASNATNYLMNGAGELSYTFNNHASINVKASFFLHDGFEDSFQRDELYVNYTNKWITASLGAKRAKTRFNDLSIVGNNFLWSGNNRALPGVLIESPKPIRITKKIAFDYGLGHYELNDQRVVSDPRIHFKKIGLHITASPKLTLVGQLHHYAIWDGISPDRGELGDDFASFRNVFLGREGEKEGQNAIGNHLGLYNFEAHLTSKKGRYILYHQHPFEDGSGSVFKNFPDGIWGVFAEPNLENYTSVFKGLVLEYIQTTNQSGRNGVSGRDNYFNNSLYQSGWTYEGNIIGLPLIEIRRNTRIQGVNAGIHLGYKQLDITLKTTFSRNFGTFFNSFNPKKDNLYSFAKAKYTFKTLGHLEVLMGYDYRSENTERFGGNISYTYSFH